MSTYSRLRNWVAVAAHFRGSAGSMKDRRAPRRGARNESRDLIHQGIEEFQEEEEESHLTASGANPPQETEEA